MPICGICGKDRPKATMVKGICGECHGQMTKSVDSPLFDYLEKGDASR